MNTDFKSLERRYGTLLALKIQEEIGRVERRQFSFYKIPEGLKAIHRSFMTKDDGLDKAMQKLA
jgi:hypothetical protein